MANKELHLLTFPTAYPLKVVCRQQAGLRFELDAIVRRHVPDFSADSVAERPSNGGRFVSVSYTLVVSSAAQIEALVRELRSHTAVTMVI
jgi:putative lipoic acid-binding regulatory protein